MLFEDSAIEEVLQAEANLEGASGSSEESINRKCPHHDQSENVYGKQKKTTPDIFLLEPAKCCFPSYEQWKEKRQKTGSKKKRKKKERKKE